MRQRPLLAVLAGTAALMASISSIEAKGPATAYAQMARSLVVCSDPNNLPFSDEAREGFENKVAELLAQSLGTPLRYVWWAQRRGYVRNTIGSARCDVWPGVAGSPPGMIISRPYYRSSYVFVTREERALEGLTLDDPRLRSLLIGVQMVGNDATNTPPAHALSERGITQNVRGFMLYGDYTQAHPAAAILDALAHRRIDVAIVWGPFAGYFASRSDTPLRLQAVSPLIDHGIWPMAFDIAVGVRSSEPELRDEINRILERRRPAIEHILEEFHIPHTAPGGAATRVAGS